MMASKRSADRKAGPKANRKANRKASPTSMLAPMIAMARHHFLGLIAVAFAVIGGSAMITAGLIVGETGVTSHLPPERLAAADILVSAPQSYPVVEDIDVALPERVTISPDLAEDIAKVPGVEEVANDLTFAISLAGLSGPADGHSWEAAALGDPTLEGHSPNGSDEVVLDSETAAAADLGVGDRTQVDAFDGTSSSYRVTGIVEAPGDGAYFSKSAAAGLADRADDEVDLVAVRVEPGAGVDDVADKIEKALGSGYLATTGDARGDVETIAGGTARGELLALAGSLAGTLLMLVGCIIASALSVSVANQRRDIALLRAVGATPRQVRRIIATQAMSVAMVALVPGIALGYVFAGVLAGELTHAGMLPDGLELARSPFAAAAVSVLMLVTVQVAARGASRRASRMSATEAVAESTVEPRQPSRVRTLLGVGLLVVALVPSVMPLFMRNETGLLASAGGTLAAIVGVMLAGPVLVRGITGFSVRRLRNRTPVPKWLAVKNSHSYALRTAGAVGVLALAIGLTLTQFFVESTLERVTTDELSAGLSADATLTGALSADDVDDLAHHTGIDAAVPMVSSTVLHDRTVAGDATTDIVPAFAFGPGADTVVDPEVSEGDLADLDGNTIAVSSPTASSWGVDVGDTVEVVLANGDKVKPRVVAIYERGFGFGNVALSTDLLAAFGGNRTFDTVLVAGDRDAARAWAADRPGTEVASGTALVDDGGSSSDTWIGRMVLLAMLGYVLVAVANSLVASTMRRRDEFATLRLIGATPRQVRTMVTRETAVMTTLAVGAGLLVSLVPMSLLGLGVSGQFWPQGPLWLIPAVSATVALIGWGATRTAAGRVLRQPV
ncbi:MAG: ABC transporter permease [Nocardioidaceae bacterium]|nr:ABC transporter permease [Nocardioidaceae bacterium]